MPAIDLTIAHTCGGSVIDLDRDPRLARFTSLGKWVIQLRPIDQESAYYTEARFGDVLVATSLPAFAFPDDNELVFVFDPPVPFYRRAMSLTYFRRDADGVRHELIPEEVR